MQKKNDMVRGIITDQGKKGDGVMRINGHPIYVENTIPGDDIQCKIVRVEKRRSYGKLVAIITPSDDRVDPDCLVANRCGGCQLQHQSYSAQTIFKHALMVLRLRRVVPVPDHVIHPMVVSEYRRGYRNKMQFALGMDATGMLQIGLYAARSHRIVNTHECTVMSPEMNAVLTVFRQWHRTSGVSVYSDETGHGCLRYLTVRYAYATDQLMVILTVADQLMDDTWVRALRAISNMASIHLSVQHDPKKDHVLGDDSHLVWQANESLNGCIQDVVCGFSCSISPRSFMQANAMMVDTLYATVIRAMHWTGDGTVLDLYCGTGILSMALATVGGMVIGVDANDSAITDAKRNALDNNVSVTFVCESVETYLAATDCSDAWVVLDPPRKGCDTDVLTAICAAKPRGIAMISCNVDTLGRDLSVLVAAGYTLHTVQAVDMFCHTPHIELVVVLRLGAGFVTVG